MHASPSPQRRLLDRIAEEEAEDRLETPGPSAQAVASGHLRGKHNYRSFRVDRHVYLGGKRVDSQVLSWDPVRAQFHCFICEHNVATGEITDAMAQRALLFNRELQVAVAGLAGAERIELAKRILSGEIASERLRKERDADPLPKGPSSDRPTVQEAHRRVQAWLWGAVAELGTLRAALDEAERVQRTDPATWREANLKLYARETLENIWEELDPAEREQAHDEHRRRTDPSD